MSGQKSAILTYHSVDDSGSAISVSPLLFRAHLQSIVSSGLKVVPLTSIFDTPASVALTFDDGYRNFLNVALPLLTEFGVPATVFVVSGYCGSHNGWHSRMKKPPRLETLSWAEVREIAQAGITIGAHTVNHRDLAILPAREVDLELRECRSHIEDRIGRPVDTLAYPYGATSDAVCEIAKQHFRFACGVRLDFVTAESNPLDLPRIDAGYLRRPFWMSNLNNWLGGAYVAAQRHLVRRRASWAGRG